MKNLTLLGWLAGKDGDCLGCVYIFLAVISIAAKWTNPR